MLRSHSIVLHAAPRAYEEEKKLLEPLGVRVVPANPNYLAQRQNLLLGA